MTVPGLDKGLPDINSTYLVAGSAATTVLVYAGTLFGLNPPPEVSSALTTLIALGLGLWKGAGYRKDRRAGDSHA